MRRVVDWFSQYAAAPLLFALLGAFGSLTGMVWQHDIALVKSKVQVEQYIQLNKRLVAVTESNNLRLYEIERMEAMDRQDIEHIKTDVELIKGAIIGK